MPRLPCLLISETPTVYHVISRTALVGLPFDDVDKDDLLGRIRRLSKVYFTEVLGFCLMDNHFHLLVRMFPEDHVSEADLEVRFRNRYGDNKVFPLEKSDALRQKWSCLSEQIYLMSGGDTIHERIFFPENRNRRGHERLSAPHHVEYRGNS